MKELQETLILKDVSFNSLFDTSRSIQQDCEDFSVSGVSSKNFRFDGDHCKLLFVSDEDKQIHGGFVTKHSMSQLCTKLGIPSRYIDKCIDSGWTNLAEDNINAWVQDYGKNLFIRRYQNTVRGILSDRFAVLDTPDILDVLSEVIPLSRYSVKGYYLSPEKFHVRLIQKDAFENLDEDLFPGLQIDSSDVGRSVLTVKFLIWKRVCTNGLCITKGSGMLFSQKHIGIDKDAFRLTFSESIKEVPHLIEYASELIKSARDNSDFNTIGFSQKQMEDFIERIKIKTKLPDEGITKVLRLMDEEYGHSRWGFVNSLTHVAQDYTLDRRLDLEKVAGEYLIA